MSCFTIGEWPKITPKEWMVNDGYILYNTTLYRLYQKSPNIFTILVPQGGAPLAPLVRGTLFVTTQALPTSQHCLGCCYRCFISYFHSTINLCLTQKYHIRPSDTIHSSCLQSDYTLWVHLGLLIEIYIYNHAGWG